MIHDDKREIKQNCRHFTDATTQTVRCRVMTLNAAGDARSLSLAVTEEIVEIHNARGGTAPRAHREQPSTMATNNHEQLIATAFATSRKTQTRQ